MAEIDCDIFNELSQPLPTDTEKNYEETSIIKQSWPRFKQGNSLMQIIGMFLYLLNKTL
jgi:hypothetical protein